MRAFSKFLLLILLLGLGAGAYYYWPQLSQALGITPANQSTPATTPNGANSASTGAGSAGGSRADSPGTLGSGNASSSENVSSRSGAGSTGGQAGPTGAGGGRSGAGMRTAVKAVTVQEKTIQANASSIGTVLPSQTVIVRSQVDGPIVSIHFEEGQMVKQGDVLFTIDKRPFEVALSQAQGSLTQNSARLNNARQDLKRYQTLFKQDSIARQQVDSQQALVREYEGTHKSLQAAVDQAKLNLEYTEVVAPMDGRVGLRNVDVGNLTNASNTDGLVTITKTQPIDVSFALPQQYIAQVAGRFYQDQPLAVSILNRDNTQVLAEGTLFSMDNQIDVSTGTVKLKARFANQDYSLFPNQFVNARIIIERIENALVIPSDAIQYGNLGTFVFLINPEDNKVQMQTIQTGVVDNGTTQVIEGLKLGDKIVIEGVDRLRNGSTVEIIP
ncbi:MAG: MdtA/MuxA family multidrug efflux RND transporter periplasmic adaptor subunit [Pelistega sp.]|nr:MdtA/MuxA family multidrug efflux RND transporter periplasmic adaptor subunit [Pelistega sp.]